MAKVLTCAKVDPSSGCWHIIRGETEEEVLRKAADHAREHGIREVTPELIERVKANIHNAWTEVLSVVKVIPVPGSFVWTRGTEPGTA
ncbi:MAG TPA: DUF1059 domain-containing protein [Syntrophorhabdaceae bacterium]|jgi:predicted small metal-binding protein